VISIARLLDIAEAAGRDILEVYAAGAGAAQVSAKADDSPLTLADRRSHECIARALAEYTPDIPVISEEGEPAASAFPPRCWVVDPLDGTKEFIKRTNEFTVNIALVEAGVPVVGVVHAPALGISWTGGPEGASRYEGGQQTAMRVEANPDLATLRIVASKDHAGPQVKAMFERLPGAQAVSMGSSIKFCLVAEGKADLYFRDGPTMEWDTAAAHAVLRAAGGDVYTLDGQPLGYGKPELRNPHFAAVGSSALDWRSLISA
jgi:3'(2'), 5'-bisphosphate nucleotidase